MIAAERFLSSSQTKSLWLADRERGVTATQVARAATPAGLEAELKAMSEPQPVYVNATMNWGIEREPWIAHAVFEQYQVLPNDWLICAEQADWHLATPDGLSLDHKTIGEYKTAGKPLDKIPINYIRQVQWQLHVTGAERCIFAYELRVETPTGFAPGFDIPMQIVERDEKEIAKLISVAEVLQEHAVNLSATA